MAQLTVHENKNPATRSTVPLLLDVQTDLLSDLETRVVVPLRPVLALKGKSLRQLTPILEVEGELFVMLTPELAGIPRSELGPPVAQLKHRRTEILAAIDFLVTGV